MKKEQKIMIGVLVGVVILALLIFFLLKGCVKEYTITFNSNGGTSVEQVKVKEKEKVPKPSNPTKEGYTFDGWYYEDELYDFDTLVTKDMTLEAYWSANSIELKTNTLNMVLGTDQKIDIVSLPNGIKKEDLIFTSSDETIVTVDKDGNLKALKAGKVTITIQTKDGKYKTTCTVTVTEEKVEVERVSITGSSSVTVGSSIKLSVTLNPSDATNEKLTWTSSDTSIATVDENGRVRGLKVGTVTITVTTENGKSATKRITVREKTTTPSNPSTPSGPSNPTPSEPTPEEPSNPENPENPDKPDTPENPDNPNVPDNPDNPDKPDTPDNPNPSDPGTDTPTNIPVKSVTIDGGDKEMKIGESAQLKVTITPGDATNQEVIWKSSDEDILTIDKDGNIKAVGIGEVTITVTVDGKKATIKIKVVKIPVESLTVNPNEVTLHVGENKKIETTVTPDNATYKTVTWKSENENVATVDSDGTIHAKGKGTTKIIATADGEKVEITVTVNDKYELYLKKVPVEGLKETFQYTATIKKNSKDFTGWLGFTLNNQDYIRKEDPNKQTVSKSDVKESNTATITLNDESVESLIVILD